MCVSSCALGNVHTEDLKVLSLLKPAAFLFVGNLLTQISLNCVSADQTNLQCGCVMDAIEEKFPHE